jgi:hypothetical protein
MTDIAAVHTTPAFEYTLGRQHATRTPRFNDGELNVLADADLAGIVPPDVAALARRHAQLFIDWLNAAGWAARATAAVPLAAEHDRTAAALALVAGTEAPAPTLPGAQAEAEQAQANLQRYADAVHTCEQQIRQLIAQQADAITASLVVVHQSANDQVRAAVGAITDALARKRELERLDLIVSQDSWRPGTSTDPGLPFDLAEALTKVLAAIEPPAPPSELVLTWDLDESSAGPEVTIEADFGELNIVEPSHAAPIRTDAGWAPRRSARAKGDSAPPTRVLEGGQPAAPPDGQEPDDATGPPANQTPPDRPSPTDKS